MVAVDFERTRGKIFRLLLLVSPLTTAQSFESASDGSVAVAEVEKKELAKSRRARNGDELCGETVVSA